MVAAYNLEAADDFVEGNKIGWNHLAGGGKMGAVHRIFTNDPLKPAICGKR